MFFDAASWREDTHLVGDNAFLYSMIPHHSRAILVCQEASLTDPEIIGLCDQIVRTRCNPAFNWAQR